MGLAEWDLILQGTRGPEFKIKPSSVFDTQYSIISMEVKHTLPGLTKTGPSEIGIFTERSFT